jgi:hypothetical protein
LVTLLVAALAVPGCAVGTVTSNWPMFMANPQRTGVAASATGTTNGTIEWQYPNLLAAVTRQLILDGAGNVVLATTDDIVFSISPSGFNRWSCTTASETITGPMAYADSLDMILVPSSTGSAPTLR